ncbi:MAG: MFS transporter [Candidatus Bipolaricaulota bacterium]
MKLNNLLKLAKKFKWLLSFHTLHHVYLLVLPPLFPLLKATIVPSYTMLGLLRGVFTISGFLMILSGRLADRIGERKCILLEFTLIPVFLILSALSPTYVYLFVFVTGLGLAKIFYHPAGLSLLSKAAGEEKRGKAIGLHESVGNIGAGLAFIAIGPLGSLLGWRLALALLGIPAWILVAVTFFGSKGLGKIVTQEDDSDSGDSGAISSRTGRALGIDDKKLTSFYLQVGSSIIGGIGFGGFVTFLASFLTEEYALSAALAGLFVGMSYLLGFFGNLFGGSISDRIGEVLAYALFTGLAALPIALVVILRLPRLLLIPCLILAFLLRSLGNPADKSLLVEHANPAQRGQGYGSLFTSYTFGSFASGPLFGFLIDSIGMRPAFLVIPALFVLGAVIRYQVKRCRFARK